MRFSWRIFAGFFLLVACLGWYGLQMVQDELKPAVRQSSEEVLIDTANLLAELLGNDYLSGRLNAERFNLALQTYKQRELHARVWGIHKTSVDFRVYVTDEHGVVQLDSTQEAIGEDYSQWRDVYLTLKGQYGARTTRSDPDDPDSSTMYVAAPILSTDGQHIRGVLSVGKSNASIKPYIARIENKIRHMAWTLGAICLALGALFSWALSRGITRLTAYARAISKGENATPPRFVANRELSTLTQALEHMRSKLDGKAYIEQSVYDLTHELKSPLSSICGAAELLSEPLPDAQARRFSGHILTEAQRMQVIVDRVLELARLENRQGIETAPISLANLLKPLIESLSVQLGSRRLEVSIASEACVQGEAFLLTQAFRNVLQNALDFTPEGGVIRLQSQPIYTHEGVIQTWRITLHNDGEPIPDFALPRLFERFFSLPGPHRKDKSSGLGLALTQAILTLHQGHIRIHNHPHAGVVVDMELPSCERLGMRASARV